MGLQLITYQTCKLMYMGRGLMPAAYIILPPSAPPAPYRITLSPSFFQPEPNLVVPVGM